MKSIVFICFYFGKFPEWFELYFETLRLNSTIDFVFYTDCDYEEFSSSNVIFNKISYEDYVFKVIHKTGIDFTPANPYKLCDFRPLLATIHNEDIKDYDFYGYADLDLIFGDIRSFYTDELLNKYDVLSTHAHTLSDHCVLFRNIDLNINMYKQIGGWAEKLASPHCVGIGEDNLFQAYQKYELNQFKRFRGFYKYIYKFRGLKLYLKEQYTTPFTPIPWINGEINESQPSSWFYKDGNITNSRDKNRNFLYLHFMNFKSSKYRHDGSIAPWEGLGKVCYASKSDMIKGLSINDKGIFPLD